MTPTYLVGFLLSQLLRVKEVSWVGEALANHGDPMVAALVLHSGNDIAGRNRGYPHVDHLRLLELHWRTSAVVFMAARVTGCTV